MDAADVQRFRVAAFLETESSISFAQIRWIHHRPKSLNLI